MPGAPGFLGALAAAAAPWAIVTSGSSALLAGWLAAMALPAPPARVVAEDVGRGKPDPECYALGRARIASEGGAEGPRMCVLEDAPSGVRAGRGAGCAVVAVATTHAVASLVAAGADWVVRDLESVALVGTAAGNGGAGGGEDRGTGWEVEIRDAWVPKA